MAKIIGTTYKLHTRIPLKNCILTTVIKKPISGDIFYNSKVWNFPKTKTAWIRRIFIIKL